MWRGLAPPIKSESENMKTINELHTMLERLILCGHADSEFALIDKTSEDYSGVKGLIIMIKDIETEDVAEEETEDTDVEVIFESEMYNR